MIREASPGLGAQGKRELLRQDPPCGLTCGHSCWSSLLALGVRLRIWLLSCSINSGFCCCICCANCWPLRRMVRLGGGRALAPQLPPPTQTGPWASAFHAGAHGSPGCPHLSPGSSPTHAWMRLARSFCEGLVPEVPKGLWPPEIIPDMLRESRDSGGSPTAVPPRPGVWPRGPPF